MRWSEGREVEGKKEEGELGGKMGQLIRGGRVEEEKRGGEKIIHKPSPPKKKKNFSRGGGGACH